MNHLPYLPRVLTRSLSALAAAFTLWLAPNLGAVTILAIDFDNADNLADADTETGFNVFLVSGADVAGVRTEVYGPYTVRLAGDASVDANGILDNSDGGTAAQGYTSRERANPTFTEDGFGVNGVFEYDDLYRDVVLGKGTDEASLVLQIAGLTASTSYRLTLYAYDNNASGSGSHTVQFSNRTGLDGVTPGTSIGSISYSFPTTFTSSTPNSVYSLTVDLTTDANGLLTVASGGGGAIGRLSGFELAVVPEPGALGLLALSGCSLALRRRRRA